MCRADDVQVEFVMLDPHVRLPLKHQGNGTYSVQFKVPDVYGVFKYVVNYNHQGFSYVQLTQQVRGAQGDTCLWATILPSPAATAWLADRVSLNLHVELVVEHRGSRQRVCATVCSDSVLHHSCVVSGCVGTS